MVRAQQLVGGLVGLAIVVVVGWSAAAHRTPSAGELAARADAQLLGDARQLVRSRMKDPDSVQFDGLRVSRAGGRPAVCGQVNARNGFGGYVGFKPFFVAGGTMVEAGDDLPPAAFIQAWARNCGTA